MCLIIQLRVQDDSQIFHVRADAHERTLHKDEWIHVIQTPVATKEYCFSLLGGHLQREKFDSS